MPDKGKDSTTITRPQSRELNSAKSMDTAGSIVLSSPPLAVAFCSFATYLLSLWAIMKTAVIAINQATKNKKGKGVSLDELTDPLFEGAMRCFVLSISLTFSLTRHINESHQRYPGYTSGNEVGDSNNPNPTVQNPNSSRHGPRIFI